MKNVTHYDYDSDLKRLTVRRSDREYCLYPQLFCTVQPLDSRRKKDVGRQGWIIRFSDCFWHDRVILLMADRMLLNTFLPSEIVPSEESDKNPFPALFKGLL